MPPRSRPIASRAKILLRLSAIFPVMLTMLSVGSLRSDPASAADTCTVSAMMVNSCRPWLGAVTNSYPQVPSDSKSQFLYHESRVGRQLDIVRVYYGYTATGLTANDIYFAKRPGTILEVTWKATQTWGTISTHNKTIDSMAASIKALGTTKIFLSLWHEPENDVSPGGDANCPTLQYRGKAGTVAQYKNMWSYVEGRFAKDGVTNVLWYLDYMNWPPWMCLVPDLYPGNNLVDWIMFNAYGSGNPPTFDTVVARFYNYLVANSTTAHNYASKPWGIAEWSIHGFPVKMEETYYTEAKTALDDGTFPLLKIYTIYDAVNLQNGNNYRVAYDDDGTYDPTKATYYYAFADDPRFADAYYNAPATPAGLTATGVSSSEIDLSWTAVADVGGYYVYRSDASTGPFVRIAIVPYGTTTHADGSGLTAGGSYYYTVAAYDKAGTGPQSSPPAMGTALA